MEARNESVNNGTCATAVGSDTDHKGTFPGFTFLSRVTVDEAIKAYVTRAKRGDSVHALYCIAYNDKWAPSGEKEDHEFSRCNRHWKVSEKESLKQKLPRPFKRKLCLIVLLVELRAESLPPLPRTPRIDQVERHRSLLLFGRPSILFILRPHLTRIGLVREVVRRSPRSLRRFRRHRVVPYLFPLPSLRLKNALNRKNRPKLTRLKIGTTSLHWKLLVNLLVGIPIPIGRRITL